MSDIAHKIGIKAPVQKVYEAIATVDGLKGWWTKHVKGESQEKSQLTFGFPKTGPVIEVLELSPDMFIKWKCIDGLEDWKETILTFDIEENNGMTDVLFGHSNWQTQSDMFAHCNTKWAVFLLSLKEFCESGKGQPFPNDIKIHQDM